MLNRAQSMRGVSQTAYAIDDASPFNSASASSSPDLEHVKRGQKRYRSILFRKKTNTTPEELINRDTLFA